MERKAISKAIRFEVFKRDKFTCQYCGRTAPDVVLEIDHIKPVSKGGTNDVLNLVTSCKDCNRGKTNRELNDNATVRIQKEQLDAMQERREQLEMMVKWRDEMVSELEIEVDIIDSVIREATEEDGKYKSLSETGRKTIKKQIRRFGFKEVLISTEIAFDRYYKGREGDASFAINKIGGICYNRKKARDNA